MDGNEKVARFQEKMGGAIVRCRLCPHGCTLQDGITGLCRTRINKGGTLYCTSFGRLCSLNVDPMEKKPLYHFYPGEPILSMATGGCTLRCLNCQNAAISQVSPQDVAVYSLTPEAVVDWAVEEHIDNLAYTYTEATAFYDFMLETASLGKERGLRSVMVSNGYINKAPLELLCPVLDAANIDVKAFDERVYRALTGASLMPVLDTLLTLKEKGVWLELTYLLVPGYSDEVKQVEALCGWMVENGFRDVPLHFSRFFPAYRLSNSKPTPVEHVLQATAFAKDRGITFVYPGNLPGSQGQDTRCPSCGQVLIERRGYVVSTKRLNNGNCSHCTAPIAGVW